MSNSICKILITLITIGFGLAYADEGRKLPTIGLIFGSDSSAAQPYEEAARAGLRDLGYIDGENVAILSRYANGDVRRVPVLLRDLIALPVDVLFVSPKAVQAAKKASRTIPIVCPTMDNAVRDGLVASLARPGANLTGISVLGTEADSKRLQLISEMVPNLRRLHVLFDATEPSAVSDVKELSTLARSVKVVLRALGVSSLEEIQAAFRTIETDRPQALIVFDNALTEQYIDVIMRFAAHRVPTISEGRDWAKAGALLTYAPDYHNMWKRGATYVDKILKGTKPADLPIEQPTKFELVVNLKTAKALGLTIPESILLRADEVIR
jgi:ABC-type uncharacterized transport system substrate-binding protein